jgi:exodeoxyribonuclease V gamma subunit
LGIRLDEGPPVLEEREPFDIKGLERYLFEQQLLERRLIGKELDGFSVVAKASGQLPPGTVGECLYEDLSRGVEDFIERTVPYTDAEPLEPVEVDLNLADVTLTGKIVGLYPEYLVRYRYAQVTAGDRIKVWINHLALNAIKGNQHPRTSLLAGLDPERVWTAWKFSPVENSETILKELLEIYKAGLIKPIHFFPKSSWVFVLETLEKKRSPHEALLKSHRTWIGNAYSRGESEDAYYQLCFKNTNPLDSEFQRVSKKIFGPLLMHQSEIGK